jgi:hypothetical protein
VKTIIKELMASDGTRKVQIFQRSDGSFGFESLRFSDDPLEMCWIVQGRYSECFARSAEAAEHEARGRVDWLLLEGDDG